ncbi:unnamed protein product [Amoebophrya sp. A25]|nr:unnamed protein product [Amoebophrya sp. A25]|eukprot:GSA25T00005561001.1
MANKMRGPSAFGGNNKIALGAGAGLADVEGYFHREPETTGSTHPLVVGSLAPVWHQDLGSVPSPANSKNSKSTTRFLCRAFSARNKPQHHGNEDRFFCEEHVLEEASPNAAALNGAPCPPASTDMFLCGVMDGHDGALAAEVVAEQLPSRVMQGLFNERKSMHEAHVAALEVCERRMKQRRSTAGACVNSVAVHNGVVYCSNLGDCRALYVPLGGLFPHYHGEKGSEDHEGTTSGKITTTINGGAEGQQEQSFKISTTTSATSGGDDPLLDEQVDPPSAPFEDTSAAGPFKKSRKTKVMPGMEDPASTTGDSTSSETGSTSANEDYASAGSKSNGLVPIQLPSRDQDLEVEGGGPPRGTGQQRRGSSKLNKPISDFGLAPPKDLLGNFFNKNNYTAGGLKSNAGSGSPEDPEVLQMQHHNCSLNAAKQGVVLGKFQWLSRDFRASRAYEKTRIRALGYHHIVGGRIAGCLEPSRTIGDLDIKQQIPFDVISIVPETRYVDMWKVFPENNPNLPQSATQPNGACIQGIIIQGTDGLWDGLGGDDIFRCLRQNEHHLQEMQRYLAETNDKDFDPDHPGVVDLLEKLAMKLVHISHGKPEVTDDCTAVVTVLSINVL